MAINLAKGNKIELAKIDGNPILEVAVGLNWGQIPKKKSFFGLFSSAIPVDLDGSAAIFDEEKKLVDVVCFQKLKSWDGAVRHSGDDLTGDANGDDNIDNEVISIDFKKVATKVKTIVLFLNSYKGHDFAEIPYSKVRIYQGTPDNIKEELARFDLSADAKFAGHVSMVMGKFFMRGNEWKFEAIGEPVESARIPATVKVIQERFL